ncbi:MAG: hypothetical protein IPG17_01610 [Sandaracinaceae bacterium]|jgi:hypothetical protein|nr:hypothetical protein [Sandaracinaceae bacterium]MBK6813384.1 hypothetical protein [Sandaracinaceae bacterium]MBK7153032.1 hypothetical protein [Sandaracinaceae bacterium]MBP7681094.1 hypothetical protein [Deltaproteobacteria bacterium]
MSYLPFVVIVVVLGIWYANYFRSVKAAGGRGNLMQKQHQEEFGLSDGETITSWWSAVCYIGPLMPGGGVPHLGEKLLHALATSNERGAQVHVCATSLGRVGVSMEPLDGLERSAAIAKAQFGSQTSFFKPYALVSAGQAKLSTFEEVFQGAPYPRSDAPKMTSALGGQVDFQLVHWWGQDGRGFSLWLDPAAVPTIRSMLAPAATTV